MYALCVSGAVNMWGSVWIFLIIRYISILIHPWWGEKEKKNREKSDPLNISLSAFFFFPQSEKNKKTLVEFMYRIFICMPGESYSRWLRSLLLCLCDAFQLLINSFGCCFHKVVATILPFFLFALSFASLFLGFFSHQHGWNLYIILPQ